MQSNALYIPAGVAHGFCVTGDEALLYYKLTTAHFLRNRRRDTLGFCRNSMADDRSASFRTGPKLPAFEDFDSPSEF